MEKLRKYVSCMVINEAKSPLLNGILLRHLFVHFSVVTHPIYSSYVS